MREQRLHIGLRIFILFLFAAFFNFCGFLTWVYLKPRSVPYLASQVEAAFDAADSGYKVKVGNTVLKWDGWREAVGIHIYNVKLFDKSEAQVASFPEAKVTLKLARLFIGDVTLRNAKLIGPTIRINVSKTPEQAEAPAPEAPAKPSQPMQGYIDAERAAGKIIGALAKTLGQIPLEGIGFERSKIIVENETQESVWNIPKADIEIADVGNGVDIVASVQVDFWGNPVTLEAEGSLYENRDSTLRIKVKDLLAEMMADVFPEEKWLRRLGGNLSGQVEVNADEQHGINSANFDFVVASDVMNFYAKGDFKNHSGHKNVEALPELTASLKLSNLPFDELKRFWSPSMGSDAREWMMEHMSGGMVKTAQAEIHLQPDDFLAPEVSRDALDATVEFEGIRLDYFEKLPVVNDVAGVAKFDGNSMTLTSEKGEMQNSKVVNSTVRIFHIGRGDEEIDIDGVVAGSVEDLLPFLYLKNASEKNGLKVDGMTGTHETDYHFKFPLLKDLLISQIDFFATSKMENVSIPNVAEDLNLTEGKFNVSVDNKGMTAAGEGKLGKAPAQVTYYEQDGEDAEFDNRYDIELKATGEELASMNIPVAEYIPDGKVKAKMEMTNKGGVISTDVGIDLADAQIIIPEAGWDKPVGIKTSIEVEAEESQPGKVHLPKIEVTGDHISIKGSGDYQKDSGLLTSLIITEAKFGRNDFTLHLNASEDNKLNVMVMGKNLNIGPYIKTRKNKEESSPRTYSFLAETRIDRLELANEKVLKKVKGYLECGVNKCTGSSLTAKWEDGKGQISVDYKKEDSQRVFSVKADEAGDFLSGLDLLSGVRDGTIETTAWTSLEDKKEPSKGKFVMKDFRVEKVPVLAQLLTLGSFTGMADLLRGQGIVFEKADGEYTYDGSVLAIHGFKASGNAVGLTADGETNLDTGQVLIRGNVVPALTVNRMLGNVLGDVPMVGTILTGGEGQGVLATRYKISGKFPEPDIEANPLSMLTPGFLRNVWGLPENTTLEDAPPADNDNKKAPEKAPAKKKTDPAKKEKIGAKP